METLREFFTSSSGIAPVRQGLGLGWIISALTGIAILLGGKEAEAECDKREWTRDFGYSAGCDEATNGRKAKMCQDCWLDSDCEISWLDSDCEIRCGGNYCCA